MSGVFNGLLGQDVFSSILLSHTLVGYFPLLSLMSHCQCVGGMWLECDMYTIKATNNTTLQ